MVEAKRYRFGDFPELFWDARPDAIIDASDPVVLARIITRGSMDAIKRLVSIEVLRERLQELAIPSHVREFWELVLAKLPPGQSPRTS